MLPHLSEQQRHALQERPGVPLHVLDAVTQSKYVLLPEAEYERVRALFEEDEFHPIELAHLTDEVAEKEGWVDPAMVVYDVLDPRRTS